MVVCSKRIHSSFSRDGDFDCLIVFLGNYYATSFYPLALNSLFRGKENNKSKFTELEVATALCQDTTIKRSIVLNSYQICHYFPLHM